LIYSIPEEKEMHIIDQRVLGILIVILLASLVAVKRAATGTILEKPEPKLLLWLVNIFNLFFLLIANPLAAILLITGKIKDIDPSSLAIDSEWLLIIIEICGFIIYLTGFFLMAWALIRLGSNYQLGGNNPRTTDTMIFSGPYTLIRHPMYTAALCIAFGLACLIESLICLFAFIIYLVLILLLIPIEEENLLRAYGKQYPEYQQKVKKLVPFIF
jgi:protein-S-isoprenylcysteine O-methyltransferase Ste14